MSPNTRKISHIHNVGRYEAHTIAGASMKAQHNTFPYGSRSGKKCKIDQQLRNANWVIDHKDNWKQQHQQQQCRG